MPEQENWTKVFTEKVVASKKSCRLKELRVSYVIEARRKKLRHKMPERKGRKEYPWCWAPAKSREASDR